jgi:hypothetical protein
MSEAGIRSGEPGLGSVFARPVRGTIERLAASRPARF